MEIARRERLSEHSEIVAWAVHQIVGSQADEKWLQKYGAFRDFVTFFKPPHLIVPEEDE